MAGSEAERAHPCRSLSRLGDFCPWEEIWQQPRIQTGGACPASENAPTLGPPWPGCVTGQSPTFVSHTPPRRGRPGLSDPHDKICIIWPRFAAGASTEDGCSSVPPPPTRGGQCQPPGPDPEGVVMTVPPPLPHHPLHHPPPPPSHPPPP